MSATHGSWCNAATWQTKCPSCKAPVFFFQCDCGSKVFFDELGDPWPQHDCEISWANNLDRTVDSSGGITVTISEGITVRRPAATFSVDSSVVSKVMQNKKQLNQHPIVAMKPEDSSGETVVGILRYSQVEVDVVKSLNLPPTSSMSSAFLGPLAKGKWGKVTLHKPSPHKKVQYSYTFWVASKSVADSRNAEGITVMAKIVPRVIPDIGVIWHCEHYEVLG